MKSALRAWEKLLWKKVDRHIEGVRLLAYDARLNDAARAEGLHLVAVG